MKKYCYFEICLATFILKGLSQRKYLYFNRQNFKSVIEIFMFRIVRFCSSTKMRNCQIKVTLFKITCLSFAIYLSIFPWLYSSLVILWQHNGSEWQINNNFTSSVVICCINNKGLQINKNEKQKINHIKFILFCQTKWTNDNLYVCTFIKTTKHRLKHHL